MLHLKYLLLLNYRSLHINEILICFFSFFPCCIMNKILMFLLTYSYLTNFIIKINTVNHTYNESNKILER